MDEKIAVDSFCEFDPKPVSLVATHSCRVYPEKQFDFVDLTETIEQLVRLADVWSGWIDIFIKHTTAVIHLGEIENFLPIDHAANLRALYSGSCLHNTAGDGCPNADSHFYASIFGTPLSRVNIEAGFLELGPFQQIALVECDDPEKRKKAGFKEYRTVTFRIYGCRK